MADSNFGLYQKKNKKTLVGKLMTVPQKETKENTPSRDPRLTKPGAVHQADLLFLPHDRGNKYALVVVDIGSRAVDAEPMKNKTQVATRNAFQKIYSRDILDLPTALLQVDDGAEFKGACAKYFTDNKVMVRYAQPGRHRQQAVVESNNGTIARALFYAQHEEELKTKKVSKKWTKNLPLVVELINKNAKKRMEALKKQPLNLDVRCEGDACKMLEQGTKVRVLLDGPRDPGTGTKLRGKFRKTDTRWDVEERKIESVVLMANQPPLYSVTGKSALYNRNQLQIIK